MRSILCCAIALCCFSSAYAESNSDQLAIREMIHAVSLENLKDFVADLQENRDVNIPDKSYKSRYCLRVQDTDNPSDGACDNAAEYILRKFAGYGLEVEYDTFVHEEEKRERYKGSYMMKNVVATLPGKGQKRDRIYIICAHYDSIAGLQTGWVWDWKTLPAPGADDNASGLAGVLEAARILSGYDFNSTIKFIAFSGEELGMFGSKHYAQSAAKSGDQIAGVINLDMIGYDPNELDIDIVTNEDSEWLGNVIYRTGDAYNVDLIVNRFTDPKMFYSDHSSFWKSGYNAALMIEGKDDKSDEFSPANHSPDDTIEKLNFELALRTTRLAVGTLARLADPVTAPDDVSDPDLLFGSLIFSHTPSQRGEIVMATARIHNLGSGDAENFGVQMYLTSPLSEGASEIAGEWSLNLGEGDSREVSAPLKLDEWGDYQVTVRVNYDAGIYESDFSNNLARGAIFVLDKLGVDKLVVYPNPAALNKNSEVNIKYELSQNAAVTMEIYDILGHLVYRENFAPGENGGKRGTNNSIKWGGMNHSLNPVASGVYICRIVALDDNGKEEGVSRKLAIIR